MRILLTNDDGISAPGLIALAEAIAPLGDIDIIAPQVCQSATGHAISVKQPLQATQQRCGQYTGWAVEGRPADCVKLGLLELTDHRPDLVLSGINAGVNTCVNVLYSGTVAAAREAALVGVPSIAFSLELGPTMDFNAAGQIARQIVETYTADQLLSGTTLCVNIPQLIDGPPTGVRVCRQSVAPMIDQYHRTEQAYTLDGTLPNIDPSHDDDLAAVARREVAITPLQHDLTDYAALDSLRTRPWALP